MKTILAALNAAYIHTNLAIRSVKAYAEAQGLTDMHLWERTINHREDLLLRELFDLQADLIIFSIYLWNVEPICNLAEHLKKIRPETRLMAAGPEVSYDSEHFLQANPAFDLVLAGEGEDSVVRLLQGGTPAIRPAPMDLDLLPFCYQDLDELTGKLIYYESMRGCPFRCAYCLSSIDSGPVRFRSLELVYQDLERFLRADVRQVKFVDRTFNCDKSRALEIWKWLAKNDNDVTGFHFEIAGELVDGDTIAFLSTVRPGLFQFEIGVQSTNQETLSAIHRPADLDKLFHNIRRLRERDNIHLHLDLIAGLPLEDYDSFARSFNAVYNLGLHQFQLGFLKVLKGSAMASMADRYGITSRATPPYEVLQTDAISYPQLCRLHAAAEMVEKYYNSGRFSALVEELVNQFPDPFSFYEALGAFFTGGGHDLVPPSKTGYYQILGDFMSHMGILHTERRQWLCRYDMALHEKPKKSPAWVRVDGSAPNRQEILRFLGGRLAEMFPRHADDDPKHVFKVCHLEVFPFHPVTGEAGHTLMAFDYSRRTVDGHAVTRSYCWESVEKRPEI